jgi:hypothetical protein
MENPLHSSISFMSRFGQNAQGKKNSLVSLDQMEGLVNYILRRNGRIKMVASNGSIKMAFYINMS